MSEKLRLGISSCLLGNKVRYNDGHSHDSLITALFEPHVDFVPVCPEIEVGFGVPREALRLIGDHERPRLVTVRSGIDFTERMEKWAEKRCIELKKENLNGFIFKSRSPSSGMERVKVYNEMGIPTKKGQGIFARIFMTCFPLLPVEDEGRLQDMRIRENFIVRVFTLKRWHDMQEKNPTASGLIEFHSNHKYLLLAHDNARYRQLGRRVSNLKNLDMREVFTQYEEILLKALKSKSTISKNVNVLQHILGFFKKHLTSDEKNEMLELISSYRQEAIPLIVPITLLNHYVMKYEQHYLKSQIYLNPHPVELLMKNHV